MAHEYSNNMYSLYHDLMEKLLDGGVLHGATMEGTMLANQDTAIDTNNFSTCKALTNAFSCFFV